MQIERHIVFWIAALAAFVGLLWLLSPILLPFVLGMALAYVLDPLANRLARRGLSRLVAASIILGGFVLALALLLLLIAPVLAKQLAGFIDHRDLAAGTQSGIDAQNRDRPSGRGQQQIVEIVTKDLYGFGVRAPLNFKADFALNG